MLPSLLMPHGTALKLTMMRFCHLNEGVNLRCGRDLTAPCSVAKVFSTARALSNPYASVNVEAAFPMPCLPRALSNDASPA